MKDGPLTSWCKNDDEMLLETSSGSGKLGDMVGGRDEGMKVKEQKTKTETIRAQHAGKILKYSSCCFLYSTLTLGLRLTITYRLIG